MELPELKYYSLVLLMVSLVWPEVSERNGENMGDFIYLIESPTPLNV